jgi:hypothetical protein
LVGDLVDVSIKLIAQAPHTIEVAYSGSDAQGRGPILHGVTDVGTKVLHQYAHHICVTRLSADVQWQRPGHTHTLTCPALQLGYVTTPDSIDDDVLRHQSRLASQKAQGKKEYAPFNRAFCETDVDG